MKTFKHGLIDGIPIGLGYISVSFTFGILAISYGLSTIETLFISMTTLTSAGQFAGLNIMFGLGSYFEMFLAQITINLRYSFMSIALSQKVDEHFKGKYRWLLGAFVTDEIFAVAISQKEKVSRQYFFGLASIPYLGWSLGTLLGALVGEVIPNTIASALGITLYGMFIAIIVPKMKESGKVAIVICIAVIIRCIFEYVPLLQHISIGFAITICSVIAAGIGAFLFPNEKEETV